MISRDKSLLASYRNYIALRQGIVLVGKTVTGKSVRMWVKMSSLYVRNISKILRQLEIRPAEACISINEARSVVAINYETIKAIEDLEPEELEIVKVLQYFDRNLGIELMKNVAHVYFESKDVAESVRQLAMAAEHRDW